MILPDADVCYRAVRGRDARFDGWFFTAVTTTGIYCRPSCPALTPRRQNVRFYPSAAAAQRSGFRACKRCRPDATPGSPDWDIRGDLAGRALRLIADGVVDREGVPGLARRLGFSERQVNRTLVAEVGAGPLALARAQRAQTARVLLESTALPAADIAFAAGFSSVRQFNDTVQEVFATTPTALRAAAPAVSGQGRLSLRLPFRRPMDVAHVIRFHALHAVEGVEAFDPVDGSFARTLDLPHGPGRVALRPGGPDWVACDLELADLRDLTAAVSRVRHLLDLEADPVAVDAVLSLDPALGRLVALRPGMRSPGCVDGPELLVRTIVGQQVSLAGARTVLGRIARAHGTPAFDDDGPRRLFPSPQTLAGLDAAALPLPRTRGGALIAAARAVVDGTLELDRGVDRAAARAAMLALPGVGPWTADYVAMRALGDPDVLLTGDLAVRRVAAAAGISLGGGRPDWAPWRSYAGHHLWAVALAGSEPRKDRS